MKLITHFMAKRFHKISFFSIFFPWVTIAKMKKLQTRCFNMKNRTSRSQMFYKMSSIKNFPKFTRKHPCRNLFFKKLYAFRLVFYYNRNTSTGFFLWIWRTFRNTFFYGKSPWDWKRILKASHCYYLWHMSFVLPNLQNIL